MGRPRHIVIAGAGVIGLACAIALRRRGLEVTVLEAGMAMKEASWAAGGMLAVQDPENPPALLPLSRYSRELYESFLREIEGLSGLAVPLRTQQTVQVLTHTADWRHERSSSQISVDEAMRLVPGMAGTEYACALLEEASLDPRDLCSAMPAAARTAGITLREQERVLSVEIGGNGVSTTTTQRTLPADAFLNCCGAWTASFAASPNAGAPAMTGITPRKGQMLVVAQPPDGPRLTCVLRSSDVYLIPRGDGRIAVGATVEDDGYCKQVDASALESLRLLAAGLWPPILNAPMLESWAGLRPASADGLPAIGRAHPDQAASFIAAGHYRNGILLAPGTAEAIADLVCGKTPAIDLAPFAPHRPSLSAACDKRFAAAL